MSSVGDTTNPRDFGHLVRLLPGHAVVVAGGAWVLLSLLMAPRLAAQQGGVVRGRVLDAETGEPIATADVSLTGGGRIVATAETDAEGRFSLAVPAPGTWRVRAGRLGYETRESAALSVKAGAAVNVELRLRPSPLLLDSIRVNARRLARPLRAGEQLLYGRVLDDDTHDPVAQATVRLLGPDSSVVALTLSNDEGRFRIVSPRPGTYRLQAERIGYRTGESKPLYLMLGDTIGLDFYLSTQAVLLQPITVTASARPWQDRADMSGIADFTRRFAEFSRSGYGEFLTRDSIASYENRVGSTGQMLMVSMPAVWSGSFLTALVTLQDHCAPRYYLNGAEVPGQMVENLLPEDLEGVEVYTAPQIPAGLDRGFPCGVVAYWLRVSPRRHAAHRTLWTVLGVGTLVALTLVLVH